MKKLSLGAFGAYYGNCDVYGSCRQVQPMTIRTVTHGKASSAGREESFTHVMLSEAIAMEIFLRITEMPTNRPVLIPTPV